MQERNNDTTDEQKLNEQDAAQPHAAEPDAAESDAARDAVFDALELPDDHPLRHPDEWKAETLETRAEDAQFHAHIEEAEAMYERAMGDATAVGLSDAIDQTLSHVMANREAEDDPGAEAAEPSPTGDDPDDSGEAGEDAPDEELEDSDEAEESDYEANDEEEDYEEDEDAEDEDYDDDYDDDLDDMDDDAGDSDDGGDGDGD